MTFILKYILVNSGFLIPTPTPYPLERELHPGVSREAASGHQSSHTLCGIVSSKIYTQVKLRATFNKEGV